MNAKNISNKVLKEIKDKKINPKPKWRFLLKKSVLWGSFSVLIVLGGVVASVIIFRLVTNDWDIVRPLGYSLPGFLFRTLPYFWIALFAAFIGIAYYNFKHTSKGYHFKWIGIVVMSVLASAVLGFASFGMGAAKHVENLALQRVPFYERLSFQQRIENWSQPDKGVMAGEIVKILGTDMIEIENLKGEKWTLNIKELPPEIKKSLKEGLIIGVIGEKMKDNVFRVDKLKPWKGNFKKNRKGAFLMKENFAGLRIN